MRFKNSSRFSAGDVINDQRRFLSPVAAVGNDDVQAVRRYLQVLKKRACGCDFVPELVIVNEVAVAEVEREQTGRGEALFAVVDGPESLLAVNAEAENRVKKMWLNGSAGVGDRSPRDPFQQLVSLRPGFRMHRKKNVAIVADSDIADRLRVLQHFLQQHALQQWWRGQVLIRFATAITDTHKNACAEADCKHENQEISQGGYLLPIGRSARP